MEPTNGDDEVLRLSDEDIREAAEEAAKEIAVIASNAGVSVQELFRGLGKTLARLNAQRREREAASMEVEEPT
ncbi:MAG: hypothetical protein NTW87_09835 [Planctomycetota bacterium]|nr:hypothetical protein [Planctomycetota bacterium]